MRPDEIRKIYSAAGKKITYQPLKQYLLDHLEPEFQELGMKLAILVASKYISEMSSIEERRQAIDTYPEQMDVLACANSECKFAVQRSWRLRFKKKGTTYVKSSSRNEKQRGLFA